MEPPNKLMAYSFVTNEHALGGCHQLSDLPDCLIHHIISLLGPNDMVRLSSLSRRLRQVCLSCPYLNVTIFSRWIRIFETVSRSSYILKCKQLNSFLEKFFNKCEGKAIHHFRLEWICNERGFSFKNSLVNDWVRNASMCNLRELVLKLGFCGSVADQVFHLPRCVFSCQSLRVLKLKLCNDPLHLPSEHFHSLEQLSLGGLHFSNFSLGDWVSTYCTSLKNLSLKDVAGIEELSIRSSSLENLSIKGKLYNPICRVKIIIEKLKVLELCFRFWNNCSIEIYAPCLQSLVRIGNAVKYSYLGSFRSLRDAKIILDEPGSATPIVKGADVTPLLRSVRWVRVLHLNIRAVATLFQENHLPILFKNLHHLVLEFEVPTELKVPTIASFLERSLVLNSLIIKFSAGEPYSYREEKFNDSSKQHDYDEEIEDWQEAPAIPQLKEVEIELKKGCCGALRVAKYLLKNANELRKMTIYYPPSYFHIIARLNLQNLERASSTAVVVLLMKD